MKEWYKLILVYLAGRKTPASPENMKQYLKKYEILKTHSAITTACKESLLDFLIRHDHSTYNDDDTVRQPRFKYSLKPDAETFATLLDMFVGTEYEEEFLKSAYIGSFSTNDLEISSAVVNTILDRFKTVHLVCNAFFPDTPLAKELDAVLAPDPFEGLTVEELYDTSAAITSAFVNGLTNMENTAIAAFSDYLTKKENERIAAGRPRVGATTRERVLQIPVEQMTAADRLTLRAIRLDEIDEKKQLPPPKTVQ